MKFQVQTQLQSLWCWAAVATSVGLLFAPKSKLTQCKVVAKTLKVPDCCTHPEQWNVEKPLQNALTAIGRLKAAIPAALSFDEVKHEIDSGRPVGARIRWRSGGAHFVLIAGYGESETNGTKLLDIEDPFYLDETLTYDSFRFAYQSGSGEWVGSYKVRK